jgi:hypothetical protein
MDQKCDHFQACVGASPTYPGEKVAGSSAEKKWRMEKELLIMSRHIMGAS